MYEEVEIGDFGELFDEILRDKVEVVVLACGDTIVAKSRVVSEGSDLSVLYLLHIQFLHLTIG